MLNQANHLLLLGRLAEASELTIQATIITKNLLMEGFDPPIGLQRLLNLVTEKVHDGFDSMR
jgi:hypothetical protein